MLREQTGEWYLPDSKLKLSGKLFVDEENEKICLCLYTDVTFHGHPLFLNKMLGPKEDEDMYVPLILGGNSTPITLYSCSWNGVSHISNKLAEFKYQIEFVFKFVHISSLENLKFKSASIKFPGLKSFYGDWNDAFGEESRNQPEQYVRIDGEVQITPNKKIVFRDLKQKRIFGTSTKDFKIIHSKDFSFEYNSSVQLETIFKDCYSFLRLLEFTSAKTLAFKIRNLTISLNNVSNSFGHMVSNDNRNGKPDYTLAHVTSTLDFEKEIFEDTSKWMHSWLLFSKWSESQEEVNNKIKKWFENEKLSPIYDFYIDSRNWFRGKVTISNVMYNNKFLNLIQGLEAFYDYMEPSYNHTNEEFVRTRQLVLNKLENRDLKKWVSNYLSFPRKATLTDKLKHLCKRYETILSGFFMGDDFVETYPYDAKEYRHKLSHGNINATYQGPEMESLYKFSQLLLCICILDSIEMPLNNIYKRIEGNLDWKRLIRVIKDRSN